MKLTQQLIAKFNTQDTFLVVSGYPSSQSKIDAVHDGMATYTKRTVEAIASKKRAQFVVLVEKETSEDPHQYAQNKVLVLPVFNKKKLTLFPVILRYLITFSQIKKIFIHSEFHIAGGISHIVLLIPFLLLIKLTGKQVYFTSHNAIHNFDDLAPHFNFKKGSLTLKIMNWGIKSRYYG